MKKIIIYTTPTCVYCKMVKSLFQQHNLLYEEKDVVMDINAREEMVNKSHQLGVPVIDVDGEIFVGFDKDALFKALGV